MKKCVYPLVVYADVEDNSYLGLFPDLDITASGFTVEDTFMSAVENLKMFLQFASKMESDIPLPSTYQETVGMNPRRIVLLAMVEIDADNLVLTDSEQQYKDMLSKILIEEK